MAEPPFRAAVLDAGGTPAGGRRGFSSRPASGLAELEAGSEALDGAAASATAVFKLGGAVGVHNLGAI